MQTKALNDLTTPSEQLQRIGMGFCGSVWAGTSALSNDETTSQPVACMKREDGGSGRSLANEYEIHQLVNAAITSKPQYVTKFSVPLCYGFLRKYHAQWPGIIPRLPSGSTACNALLSEKVQPVSDNARRLLTTIYAQGLDHEAILDDPKNQHCLVRPYLGRRRHKIRRLGRPTFFSLRNFPLHLDQMEGLGISIDPYAISMAEALAFLLWVVRIDANDIEFVLGHTNPDANNPLMIGNFGVLGPHSLWIMDFDCCRRLPMDEEGVGIAARCFWRNDPFYPRPGSWNSPDQRLWSIFRQHFLQASERMLQDEEASVRNLPALLIKKIIETRGAYDRGIIT
ncbi:hypothetical protein FZEAL_2641 [Fusarium zealandicum]|uniref:DUF3669 domain-containing protein n=1 Tax=Fusarium zealandicum TaxID=1053134 RepID=A0A8H4UQD7_9HYPO|nr:hypothetical protein FZEAL_2641 [Fusarium zealandicum]